MHIRIAIAALLITSSLSAQAQRRHGAGIHFGGYDFYGPTTENYLFSERLDFEYNDETQLYDTSRRDRLFWKPMVKFSYWWSVNRQFDVSASVSLASLRYPVVQDDRSYVNDQYFNVAGTNVDKFLGEIDFRFAYNIIPKEDFVFSPYLTAGINGSYHDVFFGADIPVGAGLNVNLSKKDNLFLNLESAYKIAATNHDADHLQHSIGFVYWFTPGYKKPKTETSSGTADSFFTPPTMVMNDDADNDGVLDNEDDCPSVAGMAQFNGCPDSDGDGVGDKEDACPVVAGLAGLNGCPDSDGDGISDKDDKCPYVSGSTNRQGCPVPDKDNDGFTDDEDRCPEKYSKTNMGCPEIRKEIITQVEKAAKAIFFEPGKAVIQKRSYPQLDAVVKILKGDSGLYADVEGHTDSDGGDDINMSLSQNRAEAVRTYFVNKGIDGARITAQGFGESQPVADNGSAAGKAQNRRTVIKLRNFEK